jgi:S-DNA-T family DNA segregation ATPase FtsK/SpoIIIE
MRPSGPGDGHGHAGRGRRTHVRPSSRPTGWEWRALAWLGRHPLFLVVPALLGWAGATLGPFPVAVALAAVGLALFSWSRAHPTSYDCWPGPVIRASWRRWTGYAGARWAHTLADCDLVRDNRRTGRAVVPRVLKVRSATPSIDTVYVRMARGQDLRTWTDRADALAVALAAHRVAITRIRPAVLALVVERHNPFVREVPPPDIPSHPDEVDLSALDVGDNEHGHPLLIGPRGRHGLVAGASGSGKSTIIWSTQRAVGPLIRTGLVRVSMIDLKGGAETQRAAPLFTRYATTPAEALDLLRAVRDELKRRQDHMRTAGLRTLDMSAEWPFELVQIDELAMLTAYGDRGDVREGLRLLAELLTQGRACGISIWGYVQEPSKDVVDVRELFTTRICLGVTAASHVDMVLGDGARERGALADEIPAGPEHAGIGFVIDEGSRLPIRFRAAHVTDDDIDELVQRCAPDPPGDGDDGSVLPFARPDTDDEHGEETAS